MAAAPAWQSPWRDLGRPASAETVYWRPLRPFPLPPTERACFPAVAKIVNEQEDRKRQIQSILSGERCHQKRILWYLKCGTQQRPELSLRPKGPECRRDRGKDATGAARSYHQLAAPRVAPSLGTAVVWLVRGRGGGVGGEGAGAPGPVPERRRSRRPQVCSWGPEPPWKAAGRRLPRSLHVPGAPAPPVLPRGPGPRAGYRPPPALAFRTLLGSWGRCRGRGQAGAPPPPRPPYPGPPEAALRPAPEEEPGVRLRRLRRGGGGDSWSLPRLPREDSWRSLCCRPSQIWTPLGDQRRTPAPPPPMPPSTCVIPLPGSHLSVSVPEAGGSVPQVSWPTST